MTSSSSKKFLRHLRQASWLYFIGVLCFLLWSLYFLTLCCLPHKVSGDIGGSTWWFPLLLFVGMVLFWGTIFGHKKQNESYRMLSRLGVPEGKIWRSRMLPATLLYVPVFVCSMCFMFKFMVGEGVFDEQASMMLWIGLPAYFTCWLAPVAMGAFFSISFRNQFAAVVLTVVGTILLLVWAVHGMNWFGFSLVWTTLPICIALLVASRLRTKDYLRNSYTWRSKFVSLTPVLGIMLAVLAAMPLVRVYSIPYVSWEQIETYFDQADLPDRLAPDKRQALIQYIANNNTLPPGHDDFFAFLFNMHKEMPSYETEMSDFDILEEYTYEEYLLLYYAYCRHVALNPLLYSDRDRCCPPPEFLERFRYTPWEAARVDRALRLRIIGSLVESDSLQDERAKSLVDWYKTWLMPIGLDQDVVGFMEAYSSPEGRLVEERLQRVPGAIDYWYSVHGTLPKSLDELPHFNTVEKIPVHPFTKKPVTYHHNAPPPLGVDYNTPDWNLYIDERAVGNVSTDFYTGRSHQEQEAARKAFLKFGGTYVRLGKNVTFFVELTEPLVVR